MMKRRDAITTLSGAMATTLLVVASGRALAQTSGRTLDLSGYRADTLQVGSLSLQASELAIARAMHPKVKQFAEFERNEQLTVAQVMTDMANPAPAKLNAQNTAILQQLQTATGKEFGTAYVQGQIAGHKSLFVIQQDYLNGTPSDHDDRHIAMLARMVIQMHLTMLADLQNSLTA